MLYFLTNWYLLDWYNCYQLSGFNLLDASNMWSTKHCNNCCEGAHHDIVDELLTFATWYARPLLHCMSAKNAFGFQRKDYIRLPHPIVRFFEKIIRYWYHIWIISSLTFVNLLIQNFKYNITLVQYSRIFIILNAFHDTHFCFTKKDINWSVYWTKSDQLKPHF